MRVTVWNENYHEQHDEPVASIYPDGIHATIASALEGHGMQVRTATQDEPGHGLGGDVLPTTDVLFWWSHIRNEYVDDRTVEDVVRRVHEGMGLVVLHSALMSKVFRRLMGTTCEVDAWRHGGRELTWQILPAHPIAEGVPHPLVVDEGEMYSEPFDVPTPDELVFITSYEGGEVLRSGMTFQRGLGRVFFFAPGHEEYPVYHNPGVRRVLLNAARWAAPPPGRTAVLPRSANLPAGWYDDQLGARP